MLDAPSAHVSGGVKALEAHHFPCGIDAGELLLRWHHCIPDLLKEPRFLRAITESCCQPSMKPQQLLAVGMAPASTRPRVKLSRDGKAQPAYEPRS